MLNATRSIDHADKASALASQALADLSAALDAGHSQALAAYLRTLARFHRYSALNCLLIGLQRPDATHVAGYGRWRDLNRQVRRGERGIAILAPCAFRKGDAEEGAGAVDGRKADGRAPGEPEGRGAATRFRTAYVFDVSQTDGEPLPSIDEVRGDPGLQLGALKSLVGELGIGLAYADALGGARGISTGGRIVLLSGMRPAEEFAVAVHELAHELLHRGERRALTTVGVRELEAEAVAYVVTTAIGLANDSASADYIGLYGGDSARLAGSLGHVQRVAAEILDYLL